MSTQQKTMFRPRALVLLMLLSGLGLTWARSRGTRGVRQGARRTSRGGQDRQLDLFDIVPHAITDAKKSGKKSSTSKSKCKTGGSCSPFVGSTTQSEPPTTMPSHGPSMSPTRSVVPTSGVHPSGAPSFDPSTAPSPAASTQPSRAPTPRPTTTPSVTASATSSANPTSKPSTYPTMNPSDSASPSELPTSGPSFSPSLLPSLAPSQTQVPTWLHSAAPSGAVVFTTTQTSNGQKISRCKENRLAALEQLSEEVAFTLQYTAVVTSSTPPEPVVEYVESRMHDEIALAYFECDFERRFLLKEQTVGQGKRMLPKASASNNELDLLSLTTEEMDQVNGDEGCNQLELLDSEGDCYVVDGSMTWRYIANSTRESIVSNIASFLSENMPVWVDGDSRLQKLSFRGFSDLTVVGEETQENGKTVTVGGLEEGVLGNTDENNGVVAGTVVVSATAVVLLVVGFLVVRRRRAHKLTYLKHTEDEGGLDIIITDHSSGEELQVAVVNDEDSLDAFDRGSKMIPSMLTEEHDSDVSCVTSNNPVCQREAVQLRPTFVSTRDMQAGIEAELAPKRRRSSSTARSYVSPDTVML